MVSTAELQHDLHGEDVAVGRDTIICDYCCGNEIEIDPDAPICYEAIAVPDGLPSSSLSPGWILDAARCHKHVITSLTYPTDGYAEALIELRVVPFDEGSYTVDGTSIQLLDYSPSDEGLKPMPLLLPAARSAILRRDGGAWRVARHVPILGVYRANGMLHYSEAIERRLAAGPVTSTGDDPDASAEGA